MTPQQRKAFQKFKTKREDEKVSAMGGYKSGGRWLQLGGIVEENRKIKRNEQIRLKIQKAKKIMG